MNLTVYRKCPCGETAHDYKGELTARLSDGKGGWDPNFGGFLIYHCRNCGAEIVPKDARSLMLRNARIAREVERAAKR